MMAEFNLILSKKRNTLYTQNISQLIMNLNSESSASYRESRIVKILFLCLFALIIINITNCQIVKNEKEMDKSTVKKFDLKKYMGQWYEIARLPNSFEKGLVGVTATYSIHANDRITVVNKGFKGKLDGKLKTANGKAKIPDINDPGKLKVSFFCFFMLIII